MDGVGTNEDVLVRIIVSQKEKNLQAIAHTFQERYDKSLKQFVASEVYYFVFGSYLDYSLLALRSGVREFWKAARRFDRVPR